MKRLGLIIPVMLVVAMAAPSLGAADCTEPPAPSVDWARCYLDGRDLVGQTLTGAHLVDASFERADLTKVAMTGANGFHAKFISAHLAGATLDDGNFAEADFTKADLSGASLRNTDLRRAHFFKAVLRGANLSGARTLGAI